MSGNSRASLDAPLLHHLHHARDSVTEAPKGLIAYEHEHSGLHDKGAHWLQVGMSLRDRSGTITHRPTPPLHCCADDLGPTGPAAGLGTVVIPRRLCPSGMGHLSMRASHPGCADRLLWVPVRPPLHHVARHW